MPASATWASERAGVGGALRAIEALADGHGGFLPVVRRGGLAGWRLQKALRHMEAHYDGDLALGALAAEVALSRCHFCTAFRQTTGFTPGEWLTALRLRRARQLIAGTPLRITEIALTVGYQTPSAFAHTFRQVFRVTPSQFRLAQWREVSVSTDFPADDAAA